MAFNGAFVSAIGKLVRVIKNGIQSLGKISPKYTFNTFMIVLSGLILFFIYNWFSSENTVKLVNMAVERALTQTKREAVKRDSLRAIKDGPAHYIRTFEVDNDINEELTKLLQKVDADRVMLSSFHDHEEGVMLGYTFYDEAYEQVNHNRHIMEVAGQYQRVRTSLTPFTYYMLKKGYYQGSFKKILDIDLRYAHRMEEDGAYFSAWYFVWSETGNPIGILSCTWQKENLRRIPTAETLEEEIKIHGEVIRTLIDQSAKDRMKAEQLK